MEFLQTLDNVICDYVNRAGKLMINYFSDLIKDVAQIKEMAVGNIRYFIVQPNCTHCATESEYNDIRDACDSCWGNYVVIRIEKVDEDKFTIKNWDVLDKKFYDTKNQELIQRYKDFVLD